MKRTRRDYRRIKRLMLALSVCALFSLPVVVSQPASAQCASCGNIIRNAVKSTLYQAKLLLWPVPYEKQDDEAEDSTIDYDDDNYPDEDYVSAYLYTLMDVMDWFMWLWIGPQYDFGHPECRPVETEDGDEYDCDQKTAERSPAGLFRNKLNGPPDYETDMYRMYDHQDYETFDSFGDLFQPDVYDDGFLLPRIVSTLTVMQQNNITAAMWQLLAIGQFFDAKNHIESMRTQRVRMTESRKRYRPDRQLCVMGTNARSLAATEMVMDAHRFELGQWGMDRQAGQANTGAAQGYHVDFKSRFNHFVSNYCDPADNNTGFAFLCSGSTASRMNSDIDYGRTVDQGLNLDLNFLDATITATEEDVMTLASYLYGHNVPFRIPEILLEEEFSRQKILDMRSLIAKRNVAQASFYTIVGMKSPSLADNIDTMTAPYMHLILQEIGMEEEDAMALFTDHPSYYAQMEFMTKKIVQNPDFYRALYEGPENVERQQIVLKGIELMQMFDMFDSYLRTEMMLSLVLETEVMDLQEEVASKINALRAE